MKNAIIAFVAIAVVFVSCRKTDDTADGKVNGVSFSASIVPITTSLGKISWIAGDQILINGIEFTTETTDTIAEFKNESDLSKSIQVPYEAYYPAAYGASIPATYSYDDKVSYLPLYASSNDHYLQFHNVCGMIGIRVTKDEMPEVMKIRVSCTDKAMCGKYRINSDNEAELITEAPMDGSNSIVLDCGSGKTISDAGTMFYIPVPPGEYENIKIELSSDGTSYGKVINAKQNRVSIAVNTIWSFLPEGSYPLSPEPTVREMM